MSSCIKLNPSVPFSRGDILKVTLNIRQSRDPDTGIYTNIGYEVVEVHSHIPRVRQLNFS